MPSKKSVGPSPADPSRVTTGSGQDATNAISGTTAVVDAPGRQFQAAPVPKNRVVSKPAPTTNPREHQINQIKRRYNARETGSTSTSASDAATSTSLTFTLQPSDPDFPFDLPKGLQCVLHVPNGYLGDGGAVLQKPSLEVKNAEMNRGYQINVERGFARLVDGNPRAGLLDWMKGLDRDLERLLIEQKAEVVTFVPNNRNIGRVIPPKRADQPPEVRSSQKATEVTPVKPNPGPLVPAKPVFTAFQLRQAAERRQAETSQLEARIGRLPLYQKTTAPRETIYTIPITPRKPAELPVSLQSVQRIKLQVPETYPLEPCRIELLDVGRDAARKTEAGFGRKVQGDGKDMPLMGLTNWLAQSMHTLALEPDPPAPEARADETVKASTLTGQAPESDLEDWEHVSNPDHDKKSHIIVIPRPPEWSMDFDGDDDDSSTDGYDTGDEDFSDDGDEEGEEGDQVDDTTGPTVSNSDPAADEGPERGVSLNFPGLELRNVELLELVSLSITVKCERCKDLSDITNLRASNGDVTTTGNIPLKPRTDSCKKCALPWSLAYRRDFLHANSVRAGYLDLNGCTPQDLLPSHFLPTCAQCSSAAVPAPGLVSVRGPSPTSSVCRTCHAHLSYTLPATKFLLASLNPRVTASILRSSAARRTPKENLGITAGTPLPDHGRCSHYAKSYRWFRFSCCARVFPCDRCHEADPTASDHPVEHATRMLCGFCSREQHYRPEDCGVCRASLIKKPGRGFWEGGKGTRDRTRMSRKGVSFSPSSWVPLHFFREILWLGSG